MFICLSVLVIAFLIGCVNSQQSSDKNSAIDTASNQKLLNKTEMIKQKITPSLWVETKDAKAVVDYYLSIFKDSKLLEHHKYQNPPEAGGGDFETAIFWQQVLTSNLMSLFLSSLTAKTRRK
jgi:hypothetical protein